MSSILPHGEPSSLQSALQLDLNHQSLHGQPQLQPPPPAPTPTKKRKKTESGDDATSPTEPRRLRRSHEACARCRSKKIKCDSKHPRCSACSTAGTTCNQEDRHRQTLTPRGHTERVEHQLAQCEALLKRHIQGFDLNNLDEILGREGVDVATNLELSAAFQFAGPPRAPPASPGGSPTKGYPYSPHHMIPPGYPMPLSFGPPGAAYAMPMQMQPPGPYSPQIHPAFQPAHPPMAPPPLQSRTAPAPDIRGQDPQANDMSSSKALAKNFGVSAAIVNDLKLESTLADVEDLGVGSSELASGRDRGASEAFKPRMEDQWFTVSLPRNTSQDHLNPPNTTVQLASTVIWLPKDRKMVKHIVEVYFTHLNIHRPVFVRQGFEETLDELYDGRLVEDDAGYICSLYLVLALGTLRELNHRASLDEVPPRNKLLPSDWPDHDEFFDRAMSVKPDLRVTISSLQALILLHWYLYTERQGRTLWRLVGSLVRVAIELGLHHDPTVQGTTFTEQECRLRINLWAIVMVHDRGTSILLGRPLGIAPSDSNTPRPSAKKTCDPAVSEHFLLSSPLAEIQADIINSLYTPTRQSGDSMLRHARRIVKSMVEFRRQLPESYMIYFGGTEDWPLEKRIKVVQEITEDQGLTLLKIGIARILLLRVLFNSKDLSYIQRRKALIDAIVTSHNIIIIHNQMISFPDTAFFVSPIPLHIAAMVILYGHMSNCNRLTREVALEDVWLALDLLPRLRWRWERKDSKGGHPLIAKLAERVLGANLLSVGPVSAPVLLSEQDLDDVSMLMSPSPSSALPSSQQANQSLASPYTSSGSPGYGQHVRNGSQSKGVAPISPDKQQLVEVPTGLFYPFYPENQNTVRFEGASPGNAAGAMNGDLNHLLTVATAQSDSAYASQSPHEAGMDGRDSNVRTNAPMQMWMGMENQRGLSYPIQQS